MRRIDYLFVCLLSICFFLFRLSVLDNIPAELFGDVIEHMQFIVDLKKTGLDLTHWWGGDGPLHTHFAYLITSIFGWTYWSMKLTSLIVGMAVAVCVWILTLNIFKNRAIAYLSLFLCLVSFWNMGQSVSGKAHIYAGLFSCLTVILYMKGQRFLTGLVIGLGIYSQVTFWGMAAYALFHPLIFLGFAISIAYFLLYSVGAHGGMLSSESYLGSKMGLSSQSTFEVIANAFLKVCENIQVNFLSLFYRGDIGFRHNVQGEPHLDIVTFALFMFGAVALLLLPLFKNKIKISPVLSYKDLLLYVFLPLGLGQATSLLVLSGESEPNISRMSGAFPFIFVIAAAGAFYLFQIISKASKAAAYVCLAILLIVSTKLNMEKFLLRYPAGLPDGNTPYGRLIAERFERMPADYGTYLIDCCWANGGQPEPLAINFVMSNGRSAPFVYPEQFTNKEICSLGIRNRDTGIYTMIEANKNYAFASHPDYKINPSDIPCLDIKETEIIEKNGHRAAKIFLMQGK